MAIALLTALLVVSPFPREVAARSMDGHEIVVADLRGHAVLLIDAGTGDAVKRIAVGGGPHELLALPDGRIVASLEQAGVLALIDFDGVVEAIEVGGTPHGLALDGETLLVTDRATNELRRFALVDWQELAPIKTGDWPHAVAVLPDGRLAIAEAGSSMLTVGEISLEVSELPETVAIDPTGGRIATAGAVGGVLHVFDSEGGLLFEVTLGGRPVRVLFSPDGGTIAVALSAAHEVALVQLDGGVRRVAVSGVPDGLAFSSDGGWLYASDVYQGALTAIDVEAGVATATFVVGESSGALLVR
ncbi:MAG: YncE family protein [Dehalococcoidia bacterium]|nr:YncE family protein [Dehalococcoidia bacterium]